MMLCFTQFTEVSIGRAPLNLEKMREMKRKLQGLYDEADELREEASDLERKAEKLEDALNAMSRPEECDVISAAAIAAWILSLDEMSLLLTPFIRDSLSRAIDQDEMRVVRAVALWFGIGLPAECWPSVPDRERVARVEPTFVLQLPLFQWRAAA